MGRETFHTLNAARGVAAICVVLFHSAKLLGFSPMPHGYLAVDLFFVLSGCVIAHAYDNRLAAGLSWRDFARLRAIRFYPLYFAGFVLGAIKEIALIATGNPHALHPAAMILVVIAGALFIPFPTAERSFNLYGLNVPSWSLFYEILVNVGYAIIFPRLTARSLPVLAAISFAAFGVYVALSGTADLGARISEVPAAIFRTVFSFTAGVIIARRGIRTFSVPPVIILLAIVLLLAAPTSLGPVYDLIFIGAISPILTIAALSAQVGRRSLGVAEYLGVISFPIYAVHRPLLEFGEAAAKARHIPGYAVCMVCIAALLVICPLLDRYYDGPMRRLLSKIFVKRTAVQTDRGTVQITAPVGSDTAHSG